jgi:hypothetical protein
MTLNFWRIYAVFCRLLFFAECFRLRLLVARTSTFNSATVPLAIRPRRKFFYLLPAVILSANALNCLYA